MNTQTDTNRVPPLHGDGGGEIPVGSEWCNFHMGWVLGHKTGSCPMVRNFSFEDKVRLLQLWTPDRECPSYANTARKSHENTSSASLPQVAQAVAADERDLRQQKVKEKKKLPARWKCGRVGHLAPALSAQHYVPKSGK